MENARYQAHRCDVVTTGRTAAACLRRAIQRANHGGYAIRVIDTEDGCEVVAYTPRPATQIAFDLEELC